MRAVHIVPTIASEAAGPSYTVPRLCGALIAAGLDVSLAALDGDSAPEGPPYLKTFPCVRGLGRVGTSPAMRRWLEAEAASGRVDVMHSHSLWMMPTVYPGLACRTGRPRLVTSPRGTLSVWALRRSAARKWVFWWLFQRRALRATACFHATAESEYEDIRRVGFTQPVCIVPNGIDVPQLERPEARPRRQLLFLGRIHQKKGIDILLRAWFAVQDRFRDWDLDIVGPDDGGYLADVTKLAATLHVERVTFRGALFGRQKLRAYREANLFVLPTHSENFGMTVAESLAAGTPAIVSKGAPWDGLEERGAGWWIEIGVDPLVACLEEAMSLPDALLAERGRAGREWMLQDYGWEGIGVRLASTYQWLVSGGEPPSFVRLD